MRRRMLLILTAIVVFAGVLWTLALGGVVCAPKGGQPFALLAAAPQAGRASAPSLTSALTAAAAADPAPKAAQPPLTVLSEGAPALNEIALTFDDGPHPGFTEPLLKILAEHNIKATFFIVGKMAEVAGDLVQREVAAGHEIGNHTYSHVCLKTCTAETANSELRRCNAVLETLTGQHIDICRPPGGVFDKAAIQTVHELGMMTVLWTCDPADYEDIPGKQIADRTIPALSPGGVVLLHDGIQGTLDALPWIISACKSRGFKFVTCSEMAAHKAAKR